MRLGSFCVGSGVVRENAENGGGESVEIYKKGGAGKVWGGGRLCLDRVC